MILIGRVAQGIIHQKTAFDDASLMGECVETRLSMVFSYPARTLATKGQLCDCFVDDRIVDATTT